MKNIITSNITRTEPYIESISNRGLLKVRFIKKLPFFNFTLLNATNITMYVKTQNDDKDLKLNFTWSCIAIKPTLMNFQLYFEEPLDISTQLPQDLFVFATNDSFIVPNLTLSTNIIPQLKNPNVTTNAEKVGEALEYTFKFLGTINLVLSIWLQGILNFILGAVQNLSFIVHFPLLDIAQPANFQNFNNFLVPIVTFELLDSAFTTELVYNFDDVKHQILRQTTLEQLENLGYETHNSILNLGSTFLFFCCYLIAFILMSLLRVCKKKNPKIENAYSYLKNKLVWSFVIQLFISSYMEVLIGAYLNIRAPIITYHGDVAGLIFGYFSIATALVILPLVYFWIIMKPLL